MQTRSRMHTGLREQIEAYMAGELPDDVDVNGEEEEPLVPSVFLNFFITFLTRQHTHNDTPNCQQTQRADCYRARAPGSPSTGYIVSSRCFCGRTCANWCNMWVGDVGERVIDRAG